ncbi:uncharacterized protein LOC133795217 [Humulus lupulus]|uniref:uncharacterized protein LOC133795217 n=1 Tax=Humulus lupulus TaxID=3486 RepID=UPI002B4020D9|nr:uncharacterized protein LOC133795217 [Humulus lupulus]
MVPGNASPHISKEEVAKCVQFGKLTKDPIEPTIYLHEKTKLSQHKMKIDPMLLECGIGRPNEFEDSYRNGSISNIEREKGAIENDFNDYEPTVLPSDKYNVDVGPYNDIQNVDGVLSCSGNEKIDVENEIGLEDDASKFRMEGKEKEKEDLGILNFEIVPEDVIPYEASVYGTTDTPVIHKIEDDDNVKIDPTILRRDKELCKMEKSFQDMILKYNKSKGRQIGAFNLKVALPQSKFELGLFLFDFSLSLRDVLVDNVMGQLERWYFRSLRPKAEVDMKIIDAFGCVLRYRDNPDGVIDDDAQTLIFPTYWPSLVCCNTNLNFLVISIK